MAGEWLRHAVSQLIGDEKLVIGDGYRARNDELAITGLPFARAGNINDGFQFGDVDRFPEADLLRVRDKISQPGDVVFTSKGTVGRFAFVRPTTPRFVYSPQLCFWRSLDLDMIHPRYLYYWMSGREFFTQFRGVAGQTDMAEYVSLTDQRSMHVTLPPIAEQRAIAHILGTLDDKIELNRRMNETLEAMARALFRSWFVDFDPVRKKMEGGEVGLPPDLAALFPDSREESAVGCVPRGWPVVPLSSLFDVNPKYPLARGSEVPYVEMSGLPTDAARVTQWRIREFTSGSRFRNGDVLVARITPCLENGKTALVDCLDGDVTAWGSTEFLVLRPHEPIPTEYVYCLSRSDAFRDYAVGSMNGSSGRQRVPVEAIERLPIVRPPDGLLRAFGQVAHMAVALMAENDRQSESLAALRDCLLPKLLSGGISL